MTKRCDARYILVAAAALGLTSLPAPAAGAAPIHLSIAGAEKTVFEGECLLTRMDGSEEALALRGSVPVERTLEGEALSCALTQTSMEGYLQVEVRLRGNVSRSRTQGEGSTLRITVR